jgi:hypothetical protein
MIVAYNARITYPAYNKFDTTAVHGVCHLSYGVVFTHEEGKPAARRLFLAVTLKLVLGAAFIYSEPVNVF